MARDAADRHDMTLDARAREILKSVIRQHIHSGEPVGSRTLSKGAGLDLSPATIRNIMADLVERGFLAQPHTSAGRVPTDAAYRLYVDAMLGPPRMVPAQAEAIDQALSRARGDIPELLAEASRQLSKFSQNVGVVLAPELGRILVERVEFIRLEAPRVVAILVDKTGVVHNRILELDVPIDQEELDRVGRYLSEQFEGRTLAQMREQILQRMKEESAAYDQLVARSLELGRQAVEGESADAGLFVGGAANLLRNRAFADLQRMRALLRTLEERRLLVELLSRVLEEEGVQVVIGRENPVADLADCSIVTSNYRAGDRLMGTVGIVGPTRMEYARAIALVDHLARVLTRLLSGTGN